VIATEEAATALPADHWTIEELGPQSLRGIDYPVRVFAVKSSPAVP